MCVLPSPFWLKPWEHRLQHQLSAPTRALDPGADLQPAMSGKGSPYGKGKGSPYGKGKGVGAVSGAELSRIAIESMGDRIDVLESTITSLQSELSAA